MAVSVWETRYFAVEFSTSDVTGAIGDSVTVLPIVVAVAMLTDLSLGVMLIWFGVFQIVWGAYYGVPISVEPMKALAGLLLAGAVTTGEFLVGGLLAGGILLLVGTTGTLDHVRRYIGERVVRGIQLAVALLLVKAGLGLALSNPIQAATASGIAVVVIAVGYWNVSALAVLGVGGIVAAGHVGWPAVTLPSVEVLAHLSMNSVTQGMVEATIGQVAMTVGNAAVATSLLVSDYFNRDVSPDTLSTSMGVMNLLAVPLGGIPLCHGSGGVAAKYAFGARTSVANFILGTAYLVLAVGAVSLVAVYPLSMLGIILVLVAAQLARTSIRKTTAYPFVVLVGLLGVVVSIGVAFLVGIVLYHLQENHDLFRNRIDR